MENARRTVITNASLVDGSGAPMRVADVAFEGDTITEVGDPGSLSTAHATRVIEDRKSTRLNSSHRT